MTGRDDLPNDEGWDVMREIRVYWHRNGRMSIEGNFESEAQAHYMLARGKETASTYFTLKKMQDGERIIIPEHDARDWPVPKHYTLNCETARIDLSTLPANLKK